jgi:hypothetical protein
MINKFHFLNILICDWWGLAVGGNLTVTMGLTSANETPRQFPLGARDENSRLSAISGMSALPGMTGLLGTPGTPGTPTPFHDSARKSIAAQGIKEHERVKSLNTLESVDY